jgi:hypothetical protein
MFYFHLNYSKTFKTVMFNSKLNPVLTGVPQDWFMCQFHIPFFALTRKNRRRPLHSMMQLLIGCMEILFLKLAVTTIFGLN